VIPTADDTDYPLVWRCPSCGAFAYDGPCGTCGYDPEEEEL